MSEAGEASKTATPEAPEYRKQKQDDAPATQFWFIVVDEGWRSWILCDSMYEWAADELLARLREAPPRKWPGA